MVQVSPAFPMGLDCISEFLKLSHRIFKKFRRVIQASLGERGKI